MLFSPFIFVYCDNCPSTSTFFLYSFFSFFLYSSRSRALHLYYSLLLFSVKLSSPPLSLSVCPSISILIYSSCFAISVAPLCSRYSLPISLASSPLFLHTHCHSFSTFFLSRSLNRCLSLLLASLVFFSALLAPLSYPCLQFRLLIYTLMTPSPLFSPSFVFSVLLFSSFSVCSPLR